MLDKHTAMEGYVQVLYSCFWNKVSLRCLGWFWSHATVQTGFELRVLQSHLPFQHYVCGSPGPHEDDYFCTSCLTGECQQLLAHSRINHRGWWDRSVVQACTALLKDPSSVPNTYIVWLTKACNYVWRGIGLNGLVGTNSHQTYAHMHTHTEYNKA